MWNIARDPSEIKRDFCHSITKELYAPYLSLYFDCNEKQEMLIVDQSHSFTHTLLNNIEWIEETEDLLQPSFFDVHLTLPLELIEILDSSISNDNNVNRISWMLTL